MSKFTVEGSDSHLSAIIWPVMILVGLFLIRTLLSFTHTKGDVSLLYSIFVEDDTAAAVFFDKFKEREYDPLYFSTADYKIMNPITHDEGIKELAAYGERAAKTEEERQRYRAMQKVCQGATLMQNFYAYTGYRQAQMVAYLPSSYARFALASVFIQSLNQHAQTQPAYLTANATPALQIRAQPAPAIHAYAPQQQQQSRYTTVVSPAQPSSSSSHSGSGVRSYCPRPYAPHDVHPNQHSHPQPQPALQVQSRPQYIVYGSSTQSPAGTYYGGAAYGRHAYYPH